MSSLSLIEISEIGANVHHVGGVLLNAFLIYVIRRFSRANIGTYKNLLQIFAAFDIFLSILQAVARPGAMIVETTFGIVTETESRAVTSFYCAVFTIPFCLLNIHFLYRFWSIRKPQFIARFSDKKIVVLISMYPIGEFLFWFLLVYFGPNGDVDDLATITLSVVFEKKYGKLLREGWMVMNYWDNGLNVRIFCVMMIFDSIIMVSFCIAVVLGSLTFYHIKKADKFSAKAHNLQWKLFIAVCAQTLVPTVFVYIPYFFIINFPFFGLPVYFFDDAGTWMTACFPAWDAVIIILLVHDYRVGVAGMVRRKKTITVEVSTVVHSISPSSVV